MTLDFSQLPLSLGDYELLELLSNDGVIFTFIAKQSLIHRDVILSLVNPELTDPSIISSFLQSARAKAQVKEGRICAVFEATNNNDGLTFYTQELPSGSNLEKLASEGASFEPIQAAQILKELALTQAYYEQHELKTSPWLPSSAFLERNGETRFLNLVECGERTPEETHRDMTAVGMYFPSLVTPGMSGVTRMYTLCSWMTGGPNAPKDINWAMVVELCDTIIGQLTASNPNATSPYVKTKKKSKAVAIILSISAILIIAAISLIFVRKNNTLTDPTPPPVARKINLPPRAHRPDIEASIYDKEENATKKLSIDLHEVTIESYDKFLQFVSNLGAPELKQFRNPNEPEEKKSYIPQDWLAMKAAAESNGTWNGHQINLKSPVTNVDYWDALAYAKWENRRLPSLSEWMAIKGDNPALFPKKENYSPVTEYSQDITDSGIGGLAGGVAEWTSTQKVNFAMPMSGKKPVICGGSYKNSGDATTEEFMNSDTSYREDLGFRTIKDLD